MKDNKGQTLVFFVILLPIILFILIFVIELSNMNYQKNKLDNLAYTLVSYKLDNVSNENIYKLMYENDKNVKGTILGTSIELKKKYKPLFIKILKDDEYIKIKYKGYIENNKKVIKKVI